jgi:nondiscriminating glutamyl-tRNA synthetase
MARRFSLESVGHSAAVFDADKLAWINRHYLREMAAERLVALALPYFTGAGLAADPSEEGRAYLASIVPMASGSVDRLEQIPDRLRFLFEFDPGRALADPEVAAVVAEPGARQVIAALAQEIAALPRLDRDRFRAAASTVKQTTGQRGKHLFHPIRVALTGEGGGPELDLAVPAIDRGAELDASAGIAPVLGCRERAAAFARALAE